MGTRVWNKTLLGLTGKDVLKMYILYRIGKYAIKGIEAAMEDENVKEKVSKVFE